MSKLSDRLVLAFQQIGTELKRLTGYKKDGATFKDSLAERGSIIVIYGDLWILTNARWDPVEEEFYRLDRTKPAFGQHLQGQNLIPGEAELGFLISGLNNWVAQPAAYDLIKGDGNPLSPRYAVTGGWELGFTLTQERQMTVGGGGIEVDGYGTTPYGRFQHTLVNNIRRTGIMTNSFTDEMGRDDTTKSSWWFGINNNGEDETWRVQYCAAGLEFTWQNVISITPAGNVTFKAGGVNLQNVNSINGNAINKSLVGLSQVDNTSDADKPVSNLAQIQLDGKVNANGSNAYGTWNINVLGLSAGVAIPDTRDTVDQPQDVLGYSTQLEFKSMNAVNNPPVSASGSFAWVQTIAGWSVDGSGGYPLQISWGGAGAAIRQGISATTWSSWKKLLIEGSPVGYVVGDGGSTPQYTSKSTAVTINKLCGRITMFNDPASFPAESAIPANSEVQFQVNNNLISLNDVVIANPVAASSYLVSVLYVSTNLFVIRVFNKTGSSLSEQISINFVTIKGVMT